MEYEVRLHFKFFCGTTSELIPTGKWMIHNHMNGGYSLFIECFSLKEINEEKIEERVEGRWPFKRKIKHTVTKKRIKLINHGMVRSDLLTVIHKKIYSNVCES